MTSVHAELKLLLAEDTKGKGVYLHVYGPDSHYGLSVYRNGRIAAFSSDCWLLACVRPVPVSCRWREKPRSVLPGVRQNAVDILIGGILSNNLVHTVEGLVTYYMWQATNGAKLLPNQDELAKVYTDELFAVYIDTPTKPVAQHYGLI